jgi:hypothetical protein
VSTCPTGGGDLPTISCNGARRLAGHTASKTVTFTIVADETLITTVGETMAADGAETALNTAIGTAAGDVVLEVVADSLSNAPAVAHVVTSSSGTTTGTGSTGNSDSGAVPIGATLPLLGICLIGATLV